MRIPKVKKAEGKHICTCGKPNYRHVSEWARPIYEIYEVEIPVAPCGETVVFLCQDCLSAIQPPNDPLTLDELREMDGEPVWVVEIKRNTGFWGLVSRITEERAVFITAGQFGRFGELRSYGKSWLAYRREPEEGTI